MAGGGEGLYNPSSQLRDELNYTKSAARRDRVEGLLTATLAATVLPIADHKA